MQYHLAPMEGVSGYVYRSAHAAVFGPLDGYITPFLAPTQSRCFSSRELREVDPEHNAGLSVTPQLIAASAENFLWAEHALHHMGYPETNLNLGCPSGTVTAKGKGAGMLARPEQLRVFLDAVFSAAAGPVSVKTRVGFSSPEEFPALLELFSQYPIARLIVHPRVREDFYRGSPRLECFTLAAARSRAPLCYNGDLFRPADAQALTARFPGVSQLMFGRGLLADPALARKLRGGPAADLEELRAFHALLWSGYRAMMPGPKPALARMKEVWSYLLFLFADRDQLLKPIRKAARPDEYESAAAAVFREGQLLPESRFDPAAL